MSIVHIPFYPSDWLAGTLGLSDTEKGVYITLVSRMYEMAGPIERDDNRLYRVCGSKSKASFVKSLEYLISEGKIIVTKEGLFNEKASKVIQQTTEKSDKAKAAAQSRWDRKPNENNGGANANASPGHMPQPCQPEPEPYKEKDTNVSLGDLGFSEFWEMWPSKTNKATAQKAWRRMSIENRRLAFSAIRDGWFERWRASKPDANPIHASSFLNGKRWDDEFTQQPHLKAINGGPNDRPYEHSQNAKRPDPALEQIARLTGIG